MQALTQAQWQWLWHQRGNSSCDPKGSPEVRDWLFELITEAGFDVRDGAVIKLV